MVVLTNFVIITQVKKINGKKSEYLKKISRDNARPREFYRQCKVAKEWGQVGCFYHVPVFKFQ